MRTTPKLLLSLILTVSMFSYLSCRKRDIFTEAEKTNTNSLEEKFFNTHRTADPTEKALVGYLKKVNDKDKFVEQTVQQIGYPRWDKAITLVNKKKAQNLLGDSIQTFYIPFVRDSQNFVNASMIIHTSQTDTSFTYRCDWQYSEMENDVNSANDPAEHFAAFFMQLDKVVFGHRKFNIVDTNLFRTAHGPAKYLKLDSSVSSNTNNYYELIEFCQDVVYYYQNCTYGNTSACSEVCDQCYLCMNSFVMTYCWEEYVYMGGGGTGGSGGGSTPLNCNPSQVPFAKGNSNNQSNIVPECGGGWTPVPDEPPSTLEILTAKFNLNTTEINWLHDNPIFAQDIINFLSNSKNAINPSTNLPWLFENPEAMLVAKSTLQAAMSGIIESGFNQPHFSILISNLPNPHNQTAYDPMWSFYFAIECINLKAEHPEWSNGRVYLEASLEIVHILLDGAGMVPVIGEVADLVNGGIYVLQGDGVNASLSLAATIPVAGWTATTAKYAKKLITAIDGSKRTLKWVKEANGLIKFGDRGLLRKVLGLAKGDSRIAHHIIPWERGSHELVQKAASGSNAFNLNEILNGIPLNSLQHTPPHGVYNDKILTKLNNLWFQNGGANMSTQTAEALVRNLTDQIRNWIVAHPNTSINDIVL